MEHRDASGLLQGYIEIDGAQLNQIKKGGSSLFIDVRERHEFPQLSEEEFKKVPMSEFGAFLDTEVIEDHVVFICQHGIRSLAAAEALYEKYGSEKHVYSLKGGVAKCAKDLL